jgi:hypothetical protein
MILITGASGNLGSKVSSQLLAKNIDIRVTGRSASKLLPFKNKTEVLPGDLEDVYFLNRVLENVHAVFLVLPLLKNTTIDQFAEQFIKAAKANGVRYIVNISNSTLKRWGQPTSLLAFETALNNAEDVHIKHLRCANFFENLNWGIHSPYKPDIKLPYISSFEIAYVAANYLQHLNFTGTSVDELMGSEDYSMNDFAHKLGIVYNQLPVSEEDKWFYDAFNNGQYELVQRTEKNTSKLNHEQFSLDHFMNHHLDKNLLQ